MNEKNNELEVLYENNTSVNSEPQPDTNNEQAVETPKRTFSISEIIFAWLSVVFGYAFCRAIPTYLNPLGAFILIVSLYIGASIIIKFNFGKLTFNAIIAAASAIIINN